MKYCYHCNAIYTFLYNWETGEVEWGQYHKYDCAYFSDYIEGSEL